MNRAQRRRAERAFGHRGSKAKRANTPKPTDDEMKPWITPDGKRLSQEEYEEVVATATRLRDKGLIIAPPNSGMLWTPGQGA